MTVRSVTVRNHESCTLSVVSMGETFRLAVRTADCCCVLLCVVLQVVKSLQEMYDRHKGSYGWEDRPLSIE